MGGRGRKKNLGEGKGWEEEGGGGRGRAKNVGEKEEDEEERK